MNVPTFKENIRFGLKLVLVACAPLLGVDKLYAQGETTGIMSDTLVFNPERAQGRFVTDGNLLLKSKVIYRGLVPSSGPAIAGNFGAMYKNVLLYLYGASGFTSKYPANTGHYQETDINLFYYRPKWDVGFNYFYNFTVGITTVPDPTGIFDFDSETARAVLDMIVRVRFGRENQWQLLSSTYVWGPRDSQGRANVDANGDTTFVHGDQRHSQYVELRRSWHVGEDYGVKAAIGGSWAWSSEDNSTFYGDKPGINNIELHVIRYFHPKESLVLPVKASTVYNPLSDNMYVYFTVELVHNAKIGH
jgi:hypothetical protein